MLQVIFSVATDGLTWLDNNCTLTALHPCPLILDCIKCTAAAFLVEGGAESLSQISVLAGEV